MHPEEFDGLGRLTGETIDWMDRRLAEFDDSHDGLTGQLRGVLSEGLYRAPEDGLTLGSAIFRLAVFHELKKTGVLTYEEFRGLKSRLLDL